MNLERTLASATTASWTTRRAIVLDWYDGPRTGVCALAHPQCEFFFHLFAEPPQGDVLAIHLFAVSELPAGCVAEVESLLQALGRPGGPLWVPVWKFSDEAARRDIEGRLDAMLVAARPTPLLVASADCLHFEGCWNADVPPPARPAFRPRTPQREEKEEG
jgi:hypothetical protein